jgi:hypothetical protein
MTLAEQISVDLRTAMKAGEVTRLATLRLLVAQITNQKIALKNDSLSDEECVKIVQREIKKRKEAAEGFLKGGRAADAEREGQEQKILEAYMPAQMSDEELEKFVREFMTGETGSAINGGKMIGAILGKLKGKVDGGRVKQMVEKILKP